MAAAYRASTIPGFYNLPPSLALRGASCDFLIFLTRFESWPTDGASQLESGPSCPRPKTSLLLVLKEYASLKIFVCLSLLYQFRPKVEKSVVPWTIILHVEAHYRSKVLRMSPGEISCCRWVHGKNIQMSAEKMNRPRHERWTLFAEKRGKTLQYFTWSGAFKYQKEIAGIGKSVILHEEKRSKIERKDEKGQGKGWNVGNVWVILHPLVS